MEAVATADDALGRDPPYRNAADGYANGSMLGRTMTLDVRRKF